MRYHLSMLLFALTLLAACARYPSSPILTADVLPATPTPPREDMMNPIILRNALTDIDTLETVRRLVEANENSQERRISCHETSK